MRNSTKKFQYVNDGKFHQVGYHYDLFRTITVLNNFPGSNINFKEIIGNYECSSLQNGLFDARVLPNYGGTENQIWYMQFAIP